MASTKPRQNWAEDDSSDEEIIVEKATPPVPQPVQEETEEESEEESESEDEEEDTLRNITTSTVAQKPVEKKKAPAQLSKKEKKELKQKELEDLDSILSQFGIEQKDNSGNQAAAQVNTPQQESKEEVGTVEESKKKKPKKKKSTASSSAVPKQDEVETAAADVIVDISQVLKSKAKAKPKKATSNDAISEALKESRSVDTKGKKSKDKKGYNEFSY